MSGSSSLPTLTRRRKQKSKHEKGETLENCLSYRNSIKRAEISSIILITVGLDFNSRNGLTNHLFRKKTCLGL
jgi:hypothetical protein